MMFSPELENLIKATLEDGVLEENEKAALVKRAQAEGVDLAELDIYINSLRQRRQRELEQEKNAQMRKYAQEKKDAFGRVCPSCGKQMAPMTLKCECGYEFTQAKSLSSAQQLAEKIDHINNTPGSSASEREKQICDAIELFPVPNTKEDVLEFLSMAVSQIKSKVSFINTYMGRILLYVVASIVSCGWFVIFALYFGWFKTLGETEGVLKERRWKAWKSKFDQVILKGRSLRGDPEFQRQLDYYENVVKK